MQAKQLFTTDDLDTALHSMQNSISAMKASAGEKQSRIKELVELLRMAQYYVDGKPVADIHKPQGAPDYALPDLPYAFRSLDDYEFIDMEDTEHESEQEESLETDGAE